MNQPTEIQQYRSELAQKLIHWEGQPFSLANYPMHVPFYDGNYKRILMKMARQCAKSLTTAAFMISECIGIPFFKSYYISPSQEQTRKFSHTRIGKILSYSNLLRKVFVDSNEISNVLLRMFKNGSEMAFSYAMDDPDRARGYSADRTCFDTNAEAMTRRGWKPVRDLQRTDEIADVNDAGIVEWHNPTEIIRRKYTGIMVRFKHAGLSLRVTSDHNMWANYRVKASPAYKTADRWEFVKAIDLARTTRMGFKMTNHCTFEGPTPTHVTIDGVDGYTVSRQPLTMPAAAFAELLGWYLAEGSIHWRCWNGVRQAASALLTQNENRFSKEIEACLRTCYLTYNKRGRVTPNTGNTCNRYVIASAPLGAYCAQFGLSRDKYIPEELFKYPALLTPLLQALYKGDASYHKGDAWDQGTLRTRSRRLADGAHRAWTILGRVSVIHTRMMPPRPGALPEPLYEVQAYEDDYAVFWRAEFASKARIAEEYVDGESVYCFTVPNHRPVIRGGFGQRPIITGQCFDEIQDMLYSEVVPVIESSMDNSKKGAYSIYSGTPKGMDNSIEFLWSVSTQSEWVMRCDGCNKSTFVDTTKALGNHGPECLNCRKPLNPRAGRWVDMKPGSRIKGFHISRAIMPENVPAAWPIGQERDIAQGLWQDRILDKMEEPPLGYGEVKFLNEVLGVSSGTGTRLLEESDLLRLCQPYELLRAPTAVSMEGIVRTYMGVDWSGGGGEIKGTDGMVKSRTIAWVWGETSDGRLKCLYYKIFSSGHIVGWVPEIIEIFNSYNCSMGVGDAGEGALANAQLREVFGHRWVQAAYMALSLPIKWMPDTLKFHIDRTTMIDNYAMFLKQERAIWGNEKVMRTAIVDCLAEYEEVTTMGRKVWRHAPTQPDDCLHAGLFGWLAWRIVSQDLSFYQG